MKGKKNQKKKRKKENRVKSKMKSNRKRRGRDLRKDIIVVLVEEAKGLLELRDLIVGELLGHSRQRKNYEGDLIVSELQKFKKCNINHKQ